MWNAVLYFSIFLIGINQNVNIFLTIDVHAGDILVGDQDGVVVVSRNKGESVAENLKAVLAREEQMAANVKAGNSKPAWFEEIKKNKGVRYTA